jgi:hypothetical protein
VATRPFQSEEEKQELDKELRKKEEEQLKEQIDMT